MNNLKTFEFKPVSYSVRTVANNGEVWFVAKDVCDALNIANSSDALSRLDDDEKGVGKTDTLGGIQNMAIVNESGLYNLIFTSNKPEAKAFRKWVTSEVLPSIRKTGQYGTKPQTARIVDDDFARKSVLNCINNGKNTYRDIAKHCSGRKPFRRMPEAYHEVLMVIRTMVNMGVLKEITTFLPKKTLLYVAK